MASERVLPSDTATEVSGEAVALDVADTPFVLRAAGAAIDLLACGLLAVLLLVVLGGMDVDASASAALSILALLLCLVVLPVTVETASRGRSLGRLAVGARIVRADGGAISFRHALVRGLTGVLELVMTLGGLAAVVGLASRRSLRLGDLLAGTRSQLERVPRAEPSPIPLPPGLEGWARIADVAGLPDRLARRIAQFLRQSGAMTPASRERLAAELAAEAAPFVAPIPPVPAIELLAGVAAVRRSREATALDLRAARLAALRPVLEADAHGFPRR